VDIGIAADVGTLQRMPKIIGNGSLMREMAFTARNVYVDEAMQCGGIFEDF
jgi:delta(3,5)-delta(2,4)-dienoyl-CoA isomerase